METSRNGNKEGGGREGGYEAEDVGYKELCIRIGLEVFCIVGNYPTNTISDQRGGAILRRKIQGQRFLSYFLV